MKSKRKNQQNCAFVESDSDDVDITEISSSDDPDEDMEKEKSHVLLRNSIPISEIEQATANRVENLARYRKIFEPFVTEKVMLLLNNVLIEKQKKYTTEPTTNSEDYIEIDTISQPPELSAMCNLRDYQLEGLSWLVRNYNSSINCILADEMGLGKTLQSISFIAHLSFVKNLSGPFLVVVPLSVLFNWISEFKKFCPRLNVLRLHSNDKDEQLVLRKKLGNRDISQVVVTTYDTVKSGGLSNAIKRICWRSVFLDEGHRIRHEQAAVTKACHALRTRFRVILTGTPVHNNLHEFGALLSFLAPNIFTDLSLFDAAFNLNQKQAAAVANKGGKNDIKRNANSSSDDDGDNSNKEIANLQHGGSKQIDRTLLANAHYMMRPFVLRRLKSEVEQKLPPKYETKINCPMSDLQKELTKALLYKEVQLISQLGRTEAQQLQLSINNSSNSNTNDSNNIIDKGRLMSLLAQLRKAANHPYLFPGTEKVAVDGLPTEEIVSSSGKMKVLDKLLSKLYDKGHRVVLFSQYTRTLDILSDYLDMRGYKHCRLDGSTNRVMREVKINLFNKPLSSYFIFCLSTRAGGEGVNLFTADTVILYDSDWNPQADIQAMARVHRIGQTKVVHVYRLVTSGSVEECIVQRAQRKLFLDNMVNRGNNKNNNDDDDDLAKQKDGNTASSDNNDSNDNDDGDNDDIVMKGNNKKRKQPSSSSDNSSTTTSTAAGDGNEATFSDNLAKRSKRRTVIPGEDNDSEMDCSSSSSSSSNSNSNNDGDDGSSSYCYLVPMNLITVDIEADEKKQQNSSNSDGEGSSSSSGGDNASSSTSSSVVQEAALCRPLYWDSFLAATVAKSTAATSVSFKSVAVGGGVANSIAMEIASAGNKSRKEQRIKWLLPILLQNNKNSKIKATDTAVVVKSAEQQQQHVEEIDEPSKVFSAVRFGWNSVFSVQQQQEGKHQQLELSDDDIDKLIDRNRGIKSENCNSVSGNADEANEIATLDAERGWLQENQEYSLDTFNENAPLVSIQDLREAQLLSSSASSSAYSSTATSSSAQINNATDDNTSSASNADISINNTAVVVSTSDDHSAASLTAGYSADTTSSNSASTVLQLPEQQPQQQLRPKRTISSRTVDIMVEGVGLIQVAKSSMTVAEEYGSSSGATAAIEKRTARQNQKKNDLLYVCNTGRQVAGRDFEHQDMCQECWDGGELIVCDLCPMAYHKECLGLDEIPSGSSMWSCPHHACITCDRKVSAATLLFRCEICPQAYCEDCLPAESTVQGESHRIDALGYRMPSNACYVLCSLDCKHYHETQIEIPTVYNAPHQLLQQKEIEAERKQKKIAKKTKSQQLVDCASSPVATTKYTAITTKEEEEDSSNNGNNMGGSNIEHALDNCSLNDIRIRIGMLPDAAGLLRTRVRFHNLGEIPNFHLRLQKAGNRARCLLLKLITDIARYQATFDSPSIINSNSDKAVTSTTATAADTVKEIDNDSSEDDDDDDDDIVRRLQAHRGAASTLTSDQIARVFLHTVGTIAQAHKSELAPLSQILGICFAMPIVRPAKLNSNSSGSNNNSNSNDNNENTGNGGGTVQDVLAAATTATTTSATTTTSTAPFVIRFINEPKFSFVREFSRQKLEEAIAALLVLPSPQNLLLSKTNTATTASAATNVSSSSSATSLVVVSNEAQATNNTITTTTIATTANVTSLTTPPTNVLPIDCLLFTARLLECLGECAGDGNNQYFAALWLKEQGMPQLKHWVSEYPLGSPAPYSTKLQWIAPAARLFQLLGYPTIGGGDKQLRSLLYDSLKSTTLAIKETNTAKLISTNNTTGSTAYNNNNNNISNTQQQRKQQQQLTDKISNNINLQYNSAVKSMINSNNKINNIDISKNFRLGCTTINNNAAVANIRASYIAKDNNYSSSSKFNIITTANSAFCNAMTASGVVSSSSGLVSSLQQQQQQRHGKEGGEGSHDMKHARTASVTSNNNTNIGNTTTSLVVSNNNGGNSTINTNLNNKQVPIATSSSSLPNNKSIQSIAATTTTTPRQVLLTSKQELMLFMRWLNQRYDALANLSNKEIFDVVVTEVASTTTTTANNTTSSLLPTTINVPSSSIVNNATPASTSSSSSSTTTAAASVERTSASVLSSPPPLFTSNTTNIFVVSKEQKQIQQRNSSAAAVIAATTATTPIRQHAIIQISDASRQKMMVLIHKQLHFALLKRSQAEVVECVRRCEYALLMRANTPTEYFDLQTLPRRIAKEVQRDSNNNNLINSDISIACTANTIDTDSMKASSNNSGSSYSHSSSSNCTDHQQQQQQQHWRQLIPPKERMLTIIRVKALLHMVAIKMQINNNEDLNIKTQQYELGLIVSSSSLDEYLNKTTLPKRLSKLVSDFCDYKATYC